MRPRPTRDTTALILVAFIIGTLSAGFRRQLAAAIDALRGRGLDPVLVDGLRARRGGRWRFGSIA